VGGFSFWQNLWRLKMNDTKLVFWIRVLWLTVGSIALIQAAIFLYALYSSENSTHKNLLYWIQSVLAGSEIVAALLFLIPRTFFFGVWALLVVFLFGVLLHVAHGEFSVGALLVYAAAALVVKAYKNSQRMKFYSAEKEQSK